MKAWTGRIVALAVGGALLAAIALGYYGSGGGGDPEERPGSSAEDGGSRGIYGWRALLDASGREVGEVDQVPARADLDPDTTAVLIDPGTIGAEDAAALRAFVADGGRLVVGGEIDANSLAAIVDAGVDRSSGRSAETLRAYVPASELAGVATITTSGEGSFTSAGGALPIAGGEDPGVLRATIGDGATLALADASPVQNRLLASGDNARFALGLTGEEDRPVVFLERVRSPAGSGLAALPGSWGWAAGGLVLAGLLLAAASARRPGPPQLHARPLPPPRRDYVDATAGLLARTHDPSATTGRLRDHARQLLVSRAGIAADASQEELRRAGLAAGLADRELEAVLGSSESSDAMLASGAALAKLWQTSGRRKL